MSNAEMDYQLSRILDGNQTAAEARARAEEARQFRAEVKRRDASRLAKQRARAYRGAYRLCTLACGAVALIGLSEFVRGAFLTGAAFVAFALALTWYGGWLDELAAKTEEMM